MKNETKQIKTKEAMKAKTLKEVAIAQIKQAAELARKGIYLF